MSDEERAVIYEQIDDLLATFDNVQEEWIEGYITTGEAIEQQNQLRAWIRALRDELRTEDNPGT